MGVKAKDLTGLVFGRWTVISRTVGDGSRFPRWNCVCECGNTGSVNGASLKNGTSKSCGCFLAEATRARFTRHGQSAKATMTAEYRAWERLRARCLNPRIKHFERYGGRGITVCMGWDTFEGFMLTMGEKPSSNHSIDRIENDSGYWCGSCAECVTLGRSLNCRWATMAEQSRNKRSSVWLEFDGERMVVADWAKRFGISRKVIEYRVKCGKTEKSDVFATVNTKKAKEAEA